MDRDQIQQLLAPHLAELRALGVRSLELFGSSARGTAGADSDVDLLVELDRPLGFFAFFRIEQRLEAILGRKVDLGTRKGLKARMRERILAEAVRVA